MNQAETDPTHCWFCLLSMMDKVRLASQLASVDPPSLSGLVPSKVNRGGIKAPVAEHGSIIWTI